MSKPTTVDGHIEAASPASQPTLRELRGLILSAVPSVAERISYGMPSYDYRGRRLVHFSAAKSHVGVYGLVHVDGAVPVGLAPYLGHRSTLRFDFKQALPIVALTAAIRAKAAEFDEPH